MNHSRGALVQAQPHEPCRPNKAKQASFLALWCVLLAPGGALLGVSCLRLVVRFLRPNVAEELSLRSMSRCGRNGTRFPIRDKGGR